MLGHDDHAAVPQWRTRALEAGDLRAALAVRRLTGDRDVVPDALRAILAGNARVPWASMSVINELGDAPTPLLPVATAYPTGTAERLHPQRDKQVLAARVVAAVAGPEGVLPTVEGVLVAGDTPAHHTADLIADLAHASRAAVVHLEPQLRDRLDDRWSRLSAARALARLGVPTAELAEPLSRRSRRFGACRPSMADRAVVGPVRRAATRAAHVPAGASVGLSPVGGSMTGRAGGEAVRQLDGMNRPLVRYV